MQLTIIFTASQGKYGDIDMVVTFEPGTSYLGFTPAEVDPIIMANSDVIESWGYSTNWLGYSMVM